MGCNIHEDYRREEDISIDENINNNEPEFFPDSLESILNIRALVCGENNKKPNNIIGRKLKEDKTERKHSKFGEDNMMNKVKTYFLKFIRDQINLTLSPGHDKFLKISKDVCANLQRDFNLELMNMTIGSIFSQYSINGSYSKSKYDKNYNSKLVAKIIRDNKEKRTIEFLNKTYCEVLDIMRKNHLKQFKKDILDKEIKNGEDKDIAEEYVYYSVDLLENYESWFREKSIRRKKIK